MPFVAGLLFLVAGALVALGAATALQLHAPFWQKSIAFLVAAGVAYNLYWAGRRFLQRG